MYLTPFLAQFRDVRGQIVLDAPNVLAAEAVGSAQLWWSVRTVQNEHGFAISSDDVDMGGPVIVRVDHHPQAIESQNSWHLSYIAKPKRLGKLFDLDGNGTRNEATQSGKQPQDERLHHVICCAENNCGA
jgi:hypothetical protein